MTDPNINVNIPAILIGVLIGVTTLSIFPYLKRFRPESYKGLWYEVGERFQISFQKVVYLVIGSMIGLAILLILERVLPSIWIKLVTPPLSVYTSIAVVFLILLSMIIGGRRYRQHEQ